ncbi:MAG: TetR/AcrR family transcriptional regulator [Pontibacterium sp.]
MSRGRPSKRQVILDAAKQLFIEQGYQGTSIDMVVKAAEVSKPTVYNNFPTKLALLSDIIPDVSNRVAACLTPNCEQPSLGELVKIYARVCELPELMMLYRVRIGEQHKLDDQVMQQLEHVDEQLATWIKMYLTDMNVPKVRAEQITQQLKATYLFARLCGESVPNTQDFAATIS